MSQKIRFEEFLSQSHLLYSVHYACETFYYVEGSTRVSAVATKNRHSQQSRVFSVFNYVQAHSVDPLELLRQPALYDAAEYSLLEQFFNYIAAQGAFANWLHWNMSTDTFGFAHLEARYRRLGGKPAVVAEANRLDLAAILHDIYGSHYMCDPKMVNLAKVNDLIGNYFMTGDKEAFAFIAAKWKDIHNSAREKASLILEIAELARSLKLRTHQTLFQGDNSVLRDVLRVCANFHKTATLLARDSYREKRQGFKIVDEYDAQHLLHSMLATVVDDIRSEESTPSFASKTAKMDFFLKKHSIGIEVKKTRAGLQDKELGDELAIDLIRYQSQQIRHLICLVYDPDHRLINPVGLQ